MRILCVNGVGTDGTGNTDELLPRLSALGHEAIDVNYRKTKLGRFQTYDRGRQFQDAAYIGTNYWKTDCVLVAHSRGGLVGWRMLEVGFRFFAVILFRPAMNRDFILPKGQENVFCVHRPNDKAIKWGGRLWFNDFGNAGRFGLDDKNVTNIEAPDYINSEFWNHSDDFIKLQVNVWATWINQTLLAMKDDGEWEYPVFPDHM